VTDNLRDRIATALRNLTGDLTYEAIADAVIRELGLVVEDGECSYCQAQLPGFRYVTEWTTDEHQEAE